MIWRPKEIESPMIIPDEMRACVAFAYYETANGSKVPAGTAFFVQDPEPRLNQTAARAYCVTARHVIEKIITHGSGGKVWLRLNNRNGGINWAGVPLTDWLGHPSDPGMMWSTHRTTERVDVSVCLWHRPNLSKFDVIAPFTTTFVDSEKITQHSIRAGDEVFATGLFANHIGKRRNIPIVRCGNIAAMPEEAVETELGPMDAFLIEARSIGGLSGSPVFVSIGGTPRRFGEEQYSFPQQWHIYLLGLIHGHWDARGGETVPDSSRQGESINQGIAVVAPATRILETIRQDQFMDIRAAEVRQILAIGPRTPDIEGSGLPS
jgi:hypothetical protein